jgi:hypothetical protein
VVKIDKYISSIYKKRYNQGLRGDDLVKITFRNRLKNSLKTWTDIKIEINNTIKTLKEWSEETNISYDTIKDRYKKGDRGERLIRPSRNKNVN